VREPNTDYTIEMVADNWAFGDVDGYERTEAATPLGELD